ncbi:UNVERIFIED_CONTAM: hypothetical protein ABID98_002345 [Brevibacillus sp. OAP136]
MVTLREACYPRIDFLYDTGSLMVLPDRKPGPSSTVLHGKIGLANARPIDLDQHFIMLRLV